MDKINGFKYKSNYISLDEEKILIENIDKLQWDTRLKRRTQHYGHLYKYKYIIYKFNENVPPVPEFLINLFKKIQTDGYAGDIQLDKLQVIINEYIPGQGISPHIDDPIIFGEWIVCISLCDSIGMIFSKYNINNSILIEKNSIYEMKNDARYKWKHSIPSVNTDIINNINHIRKRRISITFRYMKLSYDEM